MLVRGNWDCVAMSQHSNSKSAVTLGISTGASIPLNFMQIDVGFMLSSFSDSKLLIALLKSPLDMLMLHLEIHSMKSLLMTSKCHHDVDGECARLRLCIPSILQSIPGICSNITLETCMLIWKLQCRTIKDNTLQKNANLEEICECECECEVNGQNRVEQRDTDCRRSLPFLYLANY